MKALAEQPGRLGRRAKEIAKALGVADRTVRHWLAAYRKNPDIVSLLPRQRGQRVGSRRLRPDSERLIGEIHNLLSCSARDQRAALNAIKYLANKLRVSIVAAGTYEALHVMRADPQIASRFEQHELPVWTESQEQRRFIAGYLALLPLKKAAVEIDKRFVEYLLELSDGATERIIDVLRRAAYQGIADKSRKVGLQQLQYLGAWMPSVIGRRA